VANCLARFDAFVAGMPFDDFVAAVASIPDAKADEHFRSQHTFLTDRKGRLTADFVGRYERLADDFRIVQQRTGLPDIELPRLQAARSAARYAAYYTPRTRAIVADRYRRDIEMFGYEFGG
jgi:chondroitin 4-sulfotransferase 11